MPRAARKASASGFYHVMLRGVNKQAVFTDKQDCARFLRIIDQCRKDSDFLLYAYCLMGNHIHLLLQTKEEPLGNIMKRISVRYVMWYNKRHCRTGHLFQDRYKSEPIEDDRYFLTVLRYIVNNPVRAGICQKATDYRYSSARDYCFGGGVTDTAFATSIIGKGNLSNFLCEGSK